jgi:dolichol-phosphate mannosyltransferase
MNNASTDKTYDVISNLRDSHEYIHLISLSSNVGYQKSVECGLRNAKGEIFVVIDVDCEDPPELILQFIAQYELGFDLVYGIRADRSENKIMKLCRKLFYHIVRGVSDDEILLYMAEFALLTSEVRDATIASLDSFPFLRSSMARVGFKRIGIAYKRQPRIAGETHYNLYGMTVFAIASILSSTTLPLRLPLYLMPWWTLGTVSFVWAYSISGASFYLILLAIFCCIYIGGSLSAIALYLARTYKNGLQRPNYFIHHRYSFLQESLTEVD